MRENYHQTQSLSLNRSSCSPLDQSTHVTRPFNVQRIYLVFVYILHDIRVLLAITDIATLRGGTIIVEQCELDDGCTQIQSPERRSGMKLTDQMSSTKDLEALTAKLSQISTEKQKSQNRQIEIVFI